MSVANSANLLLIEPVTGTESGNWGYEINYGTTEYLDIAVAGTNNITTDADVTLTQTTGSSSGNNIVGTTAQYAVLNLSGTRAGTARNIIVPYSTVSGSLTTTVASKTYVVVNNTTITYTIKKTGGTGVSVLPGETAIVYANPVVNDVVKITSSVITNFTGILSAANGGTGVSNNSASTITISGNYGTTFTVTNTTSITLPTSGTLLSTASTVTIAQGGTNATATPTAGAVAYGTGTAYAFTSAGTTGQALLSNGSSAPTWGTAGITFGKAVVAAIIFGF